MASYTQELVYGLRPIRRNRPRLGQSEWYYLDPRETDSLGNMKQIDVPDENSPNPYATEIKNYLAANDEHSFNELYNDKTQTAVSSLNNQNNSASHNTSATDYSLYGNDFPPAFIDKMLNDDEFQNILKEYIIPNEGGYNNDANDRGGETNMGISKNAYPDENIKSMTRERANAIYYRDYYNWNGLNKLPYPIRGFVVDYGLPVGAQRALKTVHNLLGLPPKANIIGPTTLNIFKNFSDTDYENFLENYRNEMKKHFQNLANSDSKNKIYLNGWINRVNRAHLAR